MCIRTVVTHVTRRNSISLYTKYNIEPVKLKSKIKITPKNSQNIRCYFNSYFGFFLWKNRTRIDRYTLNTCNRIAR